MGAGMFNIYTERHYYDSTPATLEYRDRVHLGMSQIDTTGPWFGPGRFSAHKTAAAQGQTEFDDAYAVTASQWYASLSGPSKAALRRAYL